MNLAVFIDRQRKDNRNCDREDLRDLPMRIVGAVTIRLVDGVGIYLRTAVCLREPAEELGILARRFSGEDEYFTIGLLCRLCVSITEIPCD